jgi:hypothetical protein
MIYLIVGVDQFSLAPWYENVGAADVVSAKRIACAHAEARGINLVVAAAIGPNSTVVPDPSPVAQVDSARAA